MLSEAGTFAAVPILDWRSASDGANMRHSHRQGACAFTERSPSNLQVDRQALIDTTRGS